MDNRDYLAMNKQPKQFNCKIQHFAKCECTDKCDKGNEEIIKK